MRLNKKLYNIINKETFGEETIYTISLIPSCVIYAAHFPEMPITPGVCQIQIVKELLEDCLNKTLAIQGVKNAKFLSVLSPENNSVKVILSKIKLEDNQYRAQAVIADERNTYAKLSLQTVIAWQRYLRDYTGI